MFNVNWRKKFPQIRHFYVKTKCGSSHKLRFFSGLKEFFTMKFVYCGNDTDFVGVPTYKAEF
ncbi:hypothetical protein LEP1GSC070_2423 [Leptospira santarosai str. AIM]|nr:hypothetical protein LEP1GSC070_2423 [Leptospira santarosai str. AIM]